MPGSRKPKTISRLNINGLAMQTVEATPYGVQRLRRKGKRQSRSKLGFETTKTSSQRSKTISSVPKGNSKTPRNHLDASELPFKKARDA
jgi:hypothetical protein